MLASLFLCHSQLHLFLSNRNVIMSYHYGVISNVFRQKKQTNKKTNSTTYQIPPWYYRCSLKEKSVKDIRKQIINARLGSTKRLQFTGYWLQFIKCTVIPIQVVYSFYSYPCLFAILQFTELLKRIIELIKIQK